MDVRARRRLLGAALVAFLALSPRSRAALAAALRQVLEALAQRLARLRRPALIRKDFLQAGAAAAPGAGAPPSRGQGSGPAAEEWAWRGVAADARAGQRGAEVGAAPESVEAAVRFADFGAVLPAWLAEGLRRGGFDSMKPIQKKVLPLALAGKDVVGIAPTGSGKTLAFLVPALVHAAGQDVRLRPSDGPLVLVLAPTRELAVQIGSVAEGIMKPSRDRAHRPGLREREGFQCAVLYGGPRRTDQLQTLRFQQGTHLVVATPGRLLDFLRCGAFNLRRVSFFVLDEGDRMLDFGFEPDVAAISAEIRPDRQMLFFSATWPTEVEQAARRLCAAGQAFCRVSLESTEADASSADGEASARPRLELPGHAGITLPPREIRQHVEVLSTGSYWSNRTAIDRKLPLLLKHLEGALGGEIGPTPGKALIFVGTRNAAEELGVTVARHFGLDRCGVMHGARKQDQREATLKAFREGRLRALVSTDVLGRGVDIAHVSHVVIFDFPNDIETYVHRIGRTGRNGQRGVAITFFEPQPWYPDLAHELAEVLRACGQEVPEALVREEQRNLSGGWAWAPAGAEGGGQDQQSLWQAGASDASSGAPPLEEKGSPPLAAAEELGAWDAGGARAWGYSANGGVSEQGRVELRAKGLLRTTWGWGRWQLVQEVPAFGPPHCPPPTRPCPPLAASPSSQNSGEQAPPSPPATAAADEGAGKGAAAAAAASAAEATAEAAKAAPAPPGGEGGQPASAAVGGREAEGEVPSRTSSAAAAPPGEEAAVASTAAKWHLALTWNGVTDVVELDSSGLGFELLTRNGRPASTYKKKTLGRALPGVEL